MLQTIMSGTASLGRSTGSSTAPATAEKANPVKPQTTAPAKTPSAISRCNCKGSPDTLHPRQCVVPSAADRSRYAYQPDFFRAPILSRLFHAALPRECRSTATFSPRANRGLSPADDIARQSAKCNDLFGIVA